MEGSVNMFGSLINIISRRRVAFALFTVVILTVIFHAGTIFGLDSDFQGYALRSRLVFLGQTPYVDFFDHKPPLYYFILLPGNLLGGHLLSFFVIHLLYLSFLSILLFHYGRRIASGNNMMAGFIVVLLFLYLTAVQFFCGNNLNGGIVYPVIIFNLLVFFKTYKFLLNENSEFKTQTKQIVVIGLLSGCSFLTRFSSTPALLVSSAFLFLLLFKQVSLPRIIKLGVVYSVAFVVPTILFLLIYWPPLDILYDQLIKYNYFYSHSNELGSFIKGPAFTLLGFMKYSVLPIFICLTGFSVCFVKKELRISIPKLGIIAGIITFILAIGLLALLNHQSQYPEFFGRYSMKVMTVIIFYFLIVILSFVATVFSKKIQYIIAGSRTKKRPTSYLLICFLLIYLTFELLSVLLQKTGMKGYPFFPTFIPITFLALISISHLSSLFRYPRRIFRTFSVVLSLFVLFAFIGTVYSNTDYIITRVQWPEKKLIEKVKSLVQKPDDLFTIDYCPYIYLETNTIPPIERFWYYEPKWSMYGTKPHLKEEFLSKLIDKSPRVLLTYRPSLNDSRPSIFKYPCELNNLLQCYEKEGVYRMSYGDIKAQLYLRKDIVEAK